MARRLIEAAERKKILVILVVLLIFLSFEKVGAYGSEKEYITIVDSLGKEIRISYPVKKIAVHFPHILEVIKILGSEEFVVAVPDNVSRGQWGGLYKDFVGKKAIGSGAGPRANINIEVLLETQPDVLLAHPNTAKNLRLEETLKPYGIPVVGLDVTTLGTLKHNIITLGKILGRKKEAKTYWNFIEKYLSLIDERVKRVKPENKPKVYLEFFRDYYTCLRGFTGDPVTQRAGGINIAADLKVPQVSPEWVIEQDPDVIIKSQLPMYIPSGLGVSDPSAMEKLRKEIMSRPGWNEIKAVKDGKVYILNSNLWTSPRIWLGVIYTAKILYPERFKDIDPDAIHKEYLRKFLNIEGEGIWCWPLFGRN